MGRLYESRHEAAESGSRKKHARRPDGVNQSLPLSFAINDLTDVASFEIVSERNKASGTYKTISNKSTFFICYTFGFL